MSNKTYLVVMATPKDMEKVQHYQQESGPIMAKHGAIMPPVKLDVEKVLAGDINPVFIAQIEFPSAKHIENAFNDPDYLSLVSDRDKGFSTLNIFITSRA